MQSASLLRGLRRRLPSTLSPPHSSARAQSCALFNTANSPQKQSASAEVNNPDSSSSPPVFKYPKAQDLFERITEKCSKEDVSMIAEEINTILGRTLRKNEFFYRGFGGRKVKGKGKAGADDGEAQEEAQEAPAAKTTVDLKLSGFDAKSKIKVIKEVRSIAGLGLKEAKEMVESAPKVIQKDLKPEEAEELKKKLEEIGAQIELV